MKWSRLFVLTFPLTLMLASSAVRAGEPVTPHGVDIIISNTTGHPSGTATVTVRFVPGIDDAAAGGADEISVLQFSVTHSGLDVDPTDADNDGIPDAVHFNPDGNSILTVSFSTGVSIDSQPGQLDVLISNARRDAVLPSATLLAITFRIPAQSPLGDIALSLSNVSTKDKLSVNQPVDEAVPGVITVIAGPPTETPTATATPTRATATPTATSTRLQPTPRPTRTPAPPTPGKNTPPAGVDVTVHSENGGCAIGEARGGYGFALMFAVLLVVARRRREAH
ncbi:MAG: hypothetical protein HYR72_24710 [Deltaproteobacteria bacterium]|nr:hypothetical protein [Deltaproteobacteria bacterium]MBI3387255.1 hypothetical protein [Deltaproteobacteria bacterium]